MASNFRSLSGLLGGALLSPVIGVVSWARRGRMLHPRGIVVRAAIEPLGTTTAARQLAERLAGTALIRWSTATWKNREWPDVLGCAIRFTREPLQEEPRDGDQDLLFATVRRPWTLPFSPLTTNVRDFLANDYYAVSPFQVAELGVVEWRVHPSSPQRRDPGATRRDRLLAAVASEATFTLEYAPYRPPLRLGDTSPFQPLARIRLKETLSLDQNVLRFDPFRADRGVIPVGFIHWLRRASYASSRLQPLTRDWQKVEDPRRLPIP